MDDGFDQSKDELRSSSTVEGRKGRVGGGNAKSPEKIRNPILDSDSVECGVWQVAMQSKVVQAGQLIAPERKAEAEALVNDLADSGTEAVRNRLASVGGSVRMKARRKKSRMTKTFNGLKSQAGG